MTMLVTCCTEAIMMVMLMIVLREKYNNYTWDGDDNADDDEDDDDWVTWRLCNSRSNISDVFSSSPAEREEAGGPLRDVTALRHSLH